MTDIKMTRVLYANLTRVGGAGGDYPNEIEVPRFLLDFPSQLPMEFETKVNGFVLGSFDESMMFFPDIEQTEKERAHCLRTSPAAMSHLHHGSERLMVSRIQDGRLQYVEWDKNIITASSDNYIFKSAAASSYLGVEVGTFIRSMELGYYENPIFTTRSSNKRIRIYSVAELNKIKSSGKPRAIKPANTC